MKKTLTTVALAAGVAVGLTACGPGYSTVSNESYCVNQATGEVMPPQYCQVGSSYYQPGIYDLWVGPTYGHTYRPGTVIQHNYYTSGTKVNPSSSSARRSAGLPVSGSIGNGSKSSTTTRSVGGVPAKPGTSPGFGGSSSKSSTSSTSRIGSSTSRSSTFGSTSRSSTGFSSGSTSRSSSSFGSSSRSRP